MGKVGSVVATLIVHDQHQSTRSIHAQLGDDTCDQQAHLTQRQRWRLLLELLSYPHQKMMRQHNQYHMMMPSQPRARFVLVHAQFVLAYLERQLDWPPHTAHPRQTGCLDRFGRVAQVELHNRRVVHVPSNDQPLPWSWQTITRFIHPHKSNITHDQSLAAFLYSGACPSCFRQPPQQFIDAIGRVRWRLEALPGRFASFARPGWNDQGWCTPPNQ